MTRSVHVVDDDDAVRASLLSLLSIQSNLIVRGYRSGDDFVAEAKQLDPGVVLLDFHMPGLSGLEVLRAINPLGPKFATIVLTGQGNISLAVQAIKAGALDFLEKPYEMKGLLATIETAFARLEQENAVTERATAAKAKLNRLSARENDVLKGLIQGRPNKVIAHELNLSPRTVEIYRANLMEKLEVRSLPEALRIAFAAGFIPDESN